MIPTFLLDLKVAPPEVLYHYTSLDAATKIIEQGKLWATNLRFLNDASEYDHAVGMIRQRLQKLIAEQAPNQGRLYSLHTLLGTRPRFDHYVTSFTENGDDLSQWRGYSPSGQGACIGFRGNALAEYRNQANYEVTK